MLVFWKDGQMVPMLAHAMGGRWALMKGVL
jgi:hypothetical protein